MGDNKQSTEELAQWLDQWRIGVSYDLGSMRDHVTAVVHRDTLVNIHQAAERLRDLQAALAKYGRHDPCDFNRGSTVCTCGLSEALGE